MWQTLPEFGTLVLQAVLVTAAYAFAQAVFSIPGRSRQLISARLSAYAATSLVLAATLLLAYAFVTHDFRIRYVARYSDRSMSTGYLLAALWGGQDGSLLWWSALLSLYIAACVRFIKHRFRQLEPVMIATAMAILSFFVVVMLFAANPFQVNAQGAVAEGEGLNPLLQNYWMAIHPPMLYVGFVGCSIPFVFAIAALVTGRLDNDWILGVRKWMLFAWCALSVGNVLGMVWAYEELGWGGFWAWDPVENASSLPWFTATAYLHSTMIQERRNSFKVWNVVLICTTFFLTIFGTFLTRAGIVTSVHSFAHSNIGVYFLWFMSFVVAISLGLIVWRLPQLRAENDVEALLSREAAFVINNWALLGLMVFVTGATLFPKISEWLYQETLILGPPFFNRWTAPLGLLLFLLMGLAPLFGWRKTSPKTLKKAIVFPVAITALFVILHVVFGKSLGLPAVVMRDANGSSWSAIFLQKLSSFTPVITIALCAFNIAVILQEFFFGIRARRSASIDNQSKEGLLLSLVRLVSKSRRRYGGYIVHLGVTAMYLGFVGTVWSSTVEISVTPGKTFDVSGYRLKYLGARVCPGTSECSPKEQAEIGKTMLFADLEVYRDQKKLTTLSPAKFAYKRGQGMTTTEVALYRSLGTDLYVVLASADPNTDEAQIQVHGNPFVSWIWIGITVLIFGASLSIWPEVTLGKLRAWKIVRRRFALRKEGALS
jgi:cytochrome c-type biogenesis protein CcmF